MEEITYENSRRVPESEEYSNEELAEGVHIRVKNIGVEVFAAFDGQERVSRTRGPLGDREIIAFARGYSKAKAEYNNDNEVIVGVGDMVEYSGQSAEVVAYESPTTVVLEYRPGDRDIVSIDELE